MCHLNLDGWSNLYVNIILKKWVEKVSRMWVLFLGYSFIIKCEYDWISGICGALLNIVKSEVRQTMRDESKWKNGTNYWIGGSNKL